MSSIATAVVGQLANQFIGDIGNAALSNLNGHHVKPYGHWSSTLLWVSTALAVTTCAVSLMATFVPLFFGFSGFLMPVFSVTFGVVGVSSALGAFYINKFIPEAAFESNVKDYQNTISTFEQRLYDLERERLELQARLNELDCINKSYGEQTKSLQLDNERLKKVLEQFNEGSVDLAQKNADLNKQLQDLARISDQNESQIKVYEASNNELKHQIELLSQELGGAREGLHAFTKKIDELTGTKEALTKQVTLLKDELKRQQEFKKASDVQVGLLRDQLSEILSQLKNAEKTIGDLSEAKDSLEERAKFLEATNEGLKSNVAKLNATIETLQESFEKVSSALKSMSKTSQDLGNTSDKLSSMVGMGKEIIAKGENQAASIQNQVESFLREIESQKALVVSVLSLQDDLEKLKLAKDNFEVEVQRLSLEVISLRDENGRLKIILEHLESSTEHQSEENDRSADILEKMLKANEAFSKFLDQPLPLNALPHESTASQIPFNRVPRSATVEEKSNSSILDTHSKGIWL
jgi:chromosome segregation ATPase